MPRVLLQGSQPTALPYLGSLWVGPSTARPLEQGDGIRPRASHPCLVPSASAGMEIFSCTSWEKRSLGSITHLLGRPHSFTN